MFVFDQIISRIVKTGTLHVIDPSGVRRTYGTGQPVVTIRFHDPGLSRRMLTAHPALVIGEGWMDGGFTVENGDIYDLLDLVMANLGWAPVAGDHWVSRLRDVLTLLRRRFAQYNPIGTAQRNVAHHYDLSDTLYDLFLDPDRQYSCAYFSTPDDSIEQAQAQKKRHLAAKLLLQPGQKVLDIGSGWGGLGLYLNGISGADVTGVTLSQEQHKVSNRRAQERGVAERVRFKLQDYRLEPATYDRIVSVGMFEHVGVNHYREFFAKLRDLLDADGVALLHTIGRADGPGATNPWIAKYIFPGGYSPALSEILPHIERAGLYVTDVEVLRLHYAETLRAWRRRFNANRAAIAKLYDERFCRMWEFYLAGSEATFRYAGHVVFQIQMAKRQDAVPLTRDYIHAFEAAQPLGDMAFGGAQGAAAD
jgi:cyclopropane-fatty-acyl-phospholipid synthase